jgi:thiol-disulfide isomerase/thioredoxin
MKRAIGMLLMVGCASGPSKGFIADDPDSGSSSHPDTGTASCTYPTGPFGTSPSTVVRSDVSWTCAANTVSASELFDCDGSKGINALVFDVSAEWCAACISEAADLKTLVPQYDMLGVKLVTLMVQDASHAPASLMTASAWKQKYNLAIDVCADPSFALLPSGGGSVNLPVTIVVDPRSMIITHVGQGYVSHYPLTPDQAVMELVKKNQGK